MSRRAEPVDTLARVREGVELALLSVVLNAQSVGDQDLRGSGCTTPAARRARPTIAVTPRSSVLPPPVSEARLPDPQHASVEASGCPRL